MKTSTLSRAALLPLLLVMAVAKTSWAQEDGGDDGDWGDPTDDGSQPTDGSEVTTTDDWGSEPTTTDEWGAEPTTTEDQPWTTTTEEDPWATTSTTEWWDTTSSSSLEMPTDSALPSDVAPSEPAAPASEPASDSVTAAAPTETSDQSSGGDSGGGKSNTGAIVGGVVGGVGGAIVLGAVAFFLLRRKRKDTGDVEEFQPQNEYDEPRTSWFSEGSPYTPTTGASMSQPFMQQYNSRSSLPPPPPPQHTA